ncbi:MAG: glycine cleavage system protein H [bacterium]|nr:glycine cleavage system protein H [bacterium]
MSNEENIKVMKETPGKERLCVWAKMGVISHRLCTLNYDCNKCEFNQSLMDSSGKYAEAPEMFDIIHRLRNLPATERKCRYMLMGEVSYKLCPNNYLCGTCEYDQRMQDAIYGHPAVLARRARVDQIKVKGFLILRSLYFYNKHTWVRIIDENTVRVGLDDFAQRLLGKIEEIDFLSKKELRQGEIGWQVRTKIGDAQLLSPINGIVSKINADLSNVETRHGVSLLNTDPYGKGWVFELEPFNMEEGLKQLLKGDKAKDWLVDEIDRLSRRIESDIGVTVADGGALIHIIDKIDNKEWEKLVKEFLQ